MKTLPRFVILLLFLLVAGCSSYLAPTARKIDAATIDESALIPYRTLVRADFKAANPPSMKGPDDVQHLGAATVVIVRTTPAKVFVNPCSDGDSRCYVATIDTFVFEARMNQKRSWFGSEYKGKEAEELLRHEQVHFAIFEAEVRKANEGVSEARARIRATGKTTKEARDEAKKRFQAEERRVLDAIKERNAQFDLESANGQLADVDKLWFTLIQRELAKNPPRS